TEVKLSSAEDTERAAFRENRSSPGFFAFPGPRNLGIVATWRILRSDGGHRGTGNRPVHRAGDGCGLSVPAWRGRGMARIDSLTRPPMPCGRACGDPHDRK